MAEASAIVPTVVEERERPYDEEAVELLKKLPATELRTKWWDVWNPDKPLIERDSLVEAMKQSGLFPSDWMHDREREFGLYPDTLDPEFAAHLFEKKEFAELKSKPVDEEVSASQEFDTTAVQKLIARFMNPRTPYTSCLLFHGVGVGKTCTAITVAETFLEALPEKKVFILVPPSIEETFRKTIFNIDKLVKLPKKERELLGRIWNSPQCTGLTYLIKTGMENQRMDTKDDKEMVQSAIKSLIKQRYMIMGYGAFANWVEKSILGRVPKHIVGTERTKLEAQEIYETFSDHLIIVDEAHNLRDEGTLQKADDVDPSAVGDVAEGKRGRMMLQKILPAAEGLRLLLMTATPMYNVSTEIIGLLNLLILNDTKNQSDLLKRDTIFSKKGTLLEKGDEIIRSIAQRYVSYMRGENPTTFPLRLTPPDVFGNRIDTDYPTISLSKRETTIVLSDHLKNILKTLPLIVTELSPDTHVGKGVQKLLEERQGVKTEEEDIDEFEITDTMRKMLDPIIQMSNIFYPDGSTGTIGWMHYFSSEKYGDSPKLFRYKWNSPDAIDSIFGPAQLHQYAPKMAKIIKSLQHATGIGFVFSRFVTPGIMPLAMALERAGWTRVLANGREEPLLKDAPPLPYGRQCALCEHHEDGHKKDPHEFTPANYILLTGTDEITPSFYSMKPVAAAVQYVTSASNARGTVVKAILGSAIASEGLDLKCIREIHVLDPWYHLNRIEQVIGRGVRYNSHSALPMMERNCSIYLHAVKLPTQYETADFYAYRLAAQKSIPIGIIQRAIKIGAWDCNINYDALFMDPSKTRHIRDGQGRENKMYSLGDRPYSSFCDFMNQCTYDCKSVATAGVDTSSFTIADAMRDLSRRFQLLRNFFKTHTIAYLSLQEVREMFFKEYPWELVSLGLRSMINSSSQIMEQYDGARGKLQLLNGYIVFQPLTVTEPEIPVKLRFSLAYGRLPKKMISPLVGSTGSGKILTTTMTSEGSVEVRLSKSTAEHAFLRFELWKKEIEALQTEAHALDKKRAVPEGMKEETYRLVQWMPYRFRNFRNIEDILLQFYMDRIWTLDERHAVLHSITERKGLNQLTPVDEQILSYLKNPEIFEADGVVGYTILESNGTVTRYCKIGEAPIGVCPPIIKMEEILEEPLNGLTGCSPIYGFHVYYKRNIIFKILNKENLDAKSPQFKGSDCSITPNLKPMKEHIRILYKYKEDHKMHLLDPIILKDVDSLNAPQLCMYIELLLRAFQSVETTGLRWILSMIDSERAEEVVIKKKKESKKKIFAGAFSF